MKTIISFLLAVLILTSSKTFAQDIKTMLSLGHMYQIETAKFSKDGGYVLTTSGDNVVKLWDVKTQKLLTNFQNEAFAEFSPDGENVITYSTGAKIWEKTGKLKYVLPDKSYSFDGFSGNGKYVVLHSNFEAIIWEIATGKSQKFELKGLNGVKKIVYAPEGNYLLVITNRLLKIGDLISGKFTFEKGIGSSLIELNPNADQIAIASGNSLQLVQIPSGKVLFQTKGTAEWGEIKSVDFSLDGRWVVTSSRDNVASVWETSTGKLKQSLVGHSGPVNEAKFSPNGEFIVTSSEDKTVRVWDSSNGNTINILKCHIDTNSNYSILSSIKVTSMNFGANGKYLVTSSKMGQKVLWEIKTGNFIKVVKGLFEFSPDGVYELESIVGESGFKIFKIASGEVAYDFSSYNNTYVHLARFSTNGKNIVTASVPKIWDFATGQIVHDIAFNRGFASDASFSPDDRFVITSKNDNIIRKWDAVTGKLLFEKKFLFDNLKAIRFSSDGNYILARSNRYKHQILDSKDGNLLWIQPDSLFSINFSKDLKYVAAMSRKNSKESIGIISQINTGNVFYVEGANEGVFDQPEFSPDGSAVVFFESSKDILLYETATGKLKNTIKGHTDDISSLKFSQNGHNVISEGRDNAVKVWDVRTGKLIYDLKGNFKSTPFAEFSPDDRYILTTSGATKIWDASSGKLILDLNEDIGSARFSPDCKTLVGSTSMWAVPTGKLIARKPSILNYASEFSPDGSFLTSPSLDGGIDVWDVHTGSKLLSWIPVYPNDWVVTHPSGLFDASAGAMSKLYFVQGLDIIQFDQ
jgi:WD40 repeat protein